METLQAQVVAMLKKDCSCGNGVSVYMKHIVINTNNPDPIDLKELKDEVTRLVKQYFPEREEGLPFVITAKGVEDEGFRV